MKVTSLSNPAFSQLPLFFSQVVFRKADTHTNCKNEMCHILFIQCEKCKSKFDGCCSEECQKIHNLPLEDQKTLRKKHVKAQSNIYKKGRLRPKL